MASFQPPESHMGYVCIKCSAINFMGRRYACWLCIDYQLCGTCYDAGDLPMLAEHKYFHPLEVHYTRAEYELYFGGEPFSEANVPQSYKCAFCDCCGFTSVELYKHLTERHRGHKDFEEYFDILDTRYIAEVSSRRVPSALGLLLSGDSNSSPSNSSRQTENVFRESVRRMAHYRRNALLEMQTANIQEELRAARSNSGRLEQCAIVLGDGESRFILRPRLIRRLSPNSLQNEALFRSYDTSNLTPLVSKNPRTVSFAEVAKNAATKVDPKKRDSKKPEVNKFLCAQFYSKEKKERKQFQPDSNRGRFIGAVLCSMLSEEQLSPISVDRPVIPMDPKPVVEEKQLAKKKTTIPNKPVDVDMERFYRGLDNYNKWFDEFTKAKNLKDTAVSVVPNLFFLTKQESTLSIDSKVDDDTDERKNGINICFVNQIPLSIVGNEQQPDESNEVEVIADKQNGECEALDQEELDQEYFNFGQA